MRISDWSQTCALPICDRGDARPARGLPFGVDPSRQCTNLRRRRHDARRSEEGTRRYVRRLESARDAEAGEAFRDCRAQAAAAHPDPEERRVGKEWSIKGRSRWAPHNYKKNN